MKILVAGSGGREHAISWRLAQSHLVSEIVCVPGNGGTQYEQKCRNINPSCCAYTQKLPFVDALVQIALHENVDMAVIGPEDPLAAGIADKLWEAGIPAVGPKSAGAALEASKDAAKTFMHKYGVACAESKTFADADAAHKYIEEHGAPVVIKADGLAAGKGVVVAKQIAEAHDAVDRFMRDAVLGSAGSSVVIEDYLRGVEISVLAAVSVTEETARTGDACIIPFVPARDHKRLLDGAQGPNTGGMGAVAPLPDVSEQQMSEFRTGILEPTLRGMKAEKMDYRGFIFFGVMLTADGPKLLEYNVRLGDPETQAVLPLMDFDFAAMCKAVTDGTLSSFDFKWKKGFVCAPVAVSAGYPAAYKKGMKISIDEAAVRAQGAKVFIAGAVSDENSVLAANGGRVLAVSALGTTFEEARAASYKAMESVAFDGMFFRHDIGAPGAAESL
ncbi:MAG: phosphoribosylamine--glycine ligase [Bacteroides sp.]|nr:phosphoribosylamine--glycine ligase [Prevotella sp.]MCM1406861.1 phosphoribosylamine--glycine ligase [Treponema brennaborense]MCM1470810.1 phosphoribosylamine--glycine ligase [Bacteroides sp.]